MEAGTVVELSTVESLLLGTVALRPQDQRAVQSMQMYHVTFRTKLREFHFHFLLLPPAIQRAAFGM